MKRPYIFLAILLLFASCKPETRDSAVGYQPFSVAYIQLKVVDRPYDTLYAEARTSKNIPRDVTMSELLEISDSGTYYLEFELDRPATSTLSMNDSVFKVIAIPNDTVTVGISFSKEQMSVGFSGAEKVINEYLSAKQKKLGYYELLFPLNNMISPGMKYSQILSWTDSLTAKERAFLDNYTSWTDLPAWFIQLETADILYTGAGFKLFIPKYNELIELFDDTLPSDYFDFLASVPIDNRSAVFSERYLMFLHDYFRRDLAYEEYEALSGYARISKLVGHSYKNSKGNLTGKVKDIYNNYLFGLICQYTSDSLKIDSLAREFGIADLTAFRKVVDIKSKTDNQFPNLQVGDVVSEFTLVDENDSLVSIRDFQDKVVYINLWATWCGPCLKNIPQLNEMIEEYSGNGQIVFLNICLYSRKDNWVKTIRRNHLGGVNLFPQGSWSEILTAEFNVNGVPTYVLLDKGNKLFENHTEKAPNVKGKITELLKLKR